MATTRMFKMVQLHHLHNSMHDKLQQQPLVHYMSFDIDKTNHVTSEVKIYMIDVFKLVTLDP